MLGKTLAGLLFALGILNSAVEAATSFDSRFGENGRVLGVGGGLASQDTARTLLYQSDGKLLLVGTTSSGTNGTDFVIARLTSAGELDTSFGNGGVSAIDFAHGSDFGYDAVLQSDGKVIIVGACTTTVRVACAARINTDGSLDTTFGSQGRFTHLFANGDGSGALISVALQSDGRIVGAGSHNSGTQRHSAILRLTASGVLDSSFASAGVYTSVATGQDVQSVAIDGNQRSVAAIWSDSGDYIVTRLTTNGSLDSGFSGTGIATLNFGSSEFAMAVAVDGDDKVLIAGRASCSPTCVAGNARDGKLARLNADGSLDTSFGTAGVATTSVAKYDDFREVIVAESGIIYVGGTSFNLSTPENYLTTVAKFDSAGQPVSFGSAAATQNGALVEVHANSYGATSTTFLRGMMLLPGGELVYAGTTYDDLNPAQMHITKVAANGSLATAFQSGGVKLFNAHQDDAVRWSRSVRVVDNKRLLLGVTGGGYGVLTRVDASGIFDTSFAEQGAYVFDTADDAGIEDIGVAVQADGSIIIVHPHLNTSEASMAVRRLTSAGVLDSSFGDGGVAVGSVSASYSLATGSEDGDHDYRVAATEDGSLLVGFSSIQDTDRKVVIVRFLADGTQSSHSVVNDLGMAELGDMVSDGFNRVLITGDSQGGGFVARLTNTGSLDGTYGEAGIRILDNALPMYLTRITRVGNGSVVSGWADYGDTGFGILIKLNSVGALDTGFGTAGTQILNPIVGDNLQVHDVVANADASLFVTGRTFSDWDVDGQVFVARLTATGALDAGFGNTGAVVLASNGELDQGVAITLGSDGRLMVAGSCGTKACLSRVAAFDGSAALSNASLTFAAQTVNTVSASQSVTLTNTGAGPLTLNSLTVNGDFTVTGTCAVGDLETGSSCTVIIGFAPKSVGSLAGTVSIATAVGIQSVALSGTGTAASSGGAADAGGGGGGGGGLSWWLLSFALLPTRRRPQRS